MTSEVKNVMFDEFTEFLQLLSYPVFLLAHLYILTLNEDFSLCFYW